ncbi:cupin domain-containing protein [Roseomonas rosulenta]|uniref:cupin domain-containing protein n=1 Tax=Roseomonas rosulenta TaxID=2748667 RepID=UPI0018DF257D|nr:cupin domain-containing protein [Roseomonas rosulenta]
MTATLAEDAWSLAFGSMPFEDGLALREGTAWRLMPGNDPGRYAGLLSIADLDRFLRTDAARTPRVSMADGARKGSAAVPPDDYLEEGGDRVDLPRLLALHDGGASLVVSQFHEIHPPLARFCRGLEKAFLHAVQANIYLTPPGAQGFRVHFDTHDVLVLQVSGRKAWRVWDHIPYAAPTRHTPWANNAEAQGEPHALVMSPGDALYLPRGVMHEAMVQDGADPSLHVTVGFMEPAIGEMLRALLSELEAEEPALRAAIPTWRLADGGLDAVQHRLTAALAALARPGMADRLALAALDRLARERMSLPMRGLHSRPPGPEDRLRLSETMHHTLVPLPEGGAALRWYGGVETLDATQLAWLTALEDGATPAALGEGALGFCRRLARAGLLEVEPAGA